MREQMSMFAYDKLESQASKGQVLKVLFIYTCDLLDNNKIRLCMFGSRPYIWWSRF